MSRRKSRILAFQALYSWEVTHDALCDLLTFSWLQKDSEIKGLEEAVEPTVQMTEERNFASLIIAGTIEHIEEIDKLIENHLSSNWKIDRLNKVTLAILRCSVYEIKYQKEVDSKVIIDEALNIAKEYGTDDSYKFINAILDNIGKDESK